MHNQIHYCLTPADPATTQREQYISCIQRTLGPSRIAPCSPFCHPPRRHITARMQLPARNNSPTPLTLPRQLPCFVVRRLQFQQMLTDTLALALEPLYLVVLLGWGREYISRRFRHGGREAVVLHVKLTRWGQRGDRRASCSTAVD